MVVADPPRNVRGAIAGGKTYQTKIKNPDSDPFREVAYVFRVRRNARITATMTNTGPNIDGQFDCFDADFLNADGDELTFPSAECISPGRTDRLRRQLRRGKYYLRFNRITDTVRFTFRLTPASAIRKPR